MGVTSRYNRTGWAGRAPPLAALGQARCHAAPSWPVTGCVWASVGPRMCRKFRGEKRVQLPPDLEGVWKSLQPGEFPQSSCRPGSLVKQIRGMWHPRGTHCSERCRNISSCDPHSKPATWVSLLLHTMDGREIERLSQGTQQGGSGAGTEGHGPALCS